MSKLKTGTQKRIYRGDTEIDHDLYRLKVAHMVKNVSYTEIPDYEKIEHCHIFHTVDSNGKKQTACSPVGNHFHEVKLVEREGGVPSLEVSAAMRWATRRIKGRVKRVAEPISDRDGNVYDTHTHDFEYMRSERIKLRVQNAEAAKAEAIMARRVEPEMLAGVETD